MQFFRSQLSRFIPHPHRDSWMRNNLDNWLYLLRLTASLTLIASGCFLLFFNSPISPIGRNLDITTVISDTLSNYHVSNVEQTSQYIIWGLAGYFLMCGILCFRCGERKKPKYVIPVFVSFLILLTCLVMLLASHSFNPYEAIPYIIPLSSPLALLLYRQWQNKLDHWNYFLITILLITTASYAAGVFLSEETIIDTALVSLMERIGIGAQFTAQITKSIVAVGFIAGLLLFSACGRRIALITLIIIAIIHLLVRFISHLSTDAAWYGIDYWTTDLIFHLSYVMYPTLTLLSLASRRKTQTLRL